ncbi:MAG: DUF1893 domain-containing protein [Candidatus Bathyarchaeia archaeon]
MEKLNDLEVAKAKLLSSNLNLVIVKEGRIIFESRRRGILGFIEAIDSLGPSLKGTTVADRIVGRAIALLCLYAGVGSLYALTLSREGKEVLEQSGIYYTWEHMVDNILSPDGMDICPFEKISQGINNPVEAYKKFREMLERSL